MNKQLYKLHRTLSLIIAVPVLLWASSGFMHPLMTNIRPAIATQGLPAVTIDTQRIHVPLQTALRMHHLDSFYNFRLVHIDTNWFYQVQLNAPNFPGSSSNAAPGQANNTTPIYLSCVNGNVLAAGDWLYAQYLARQFLEGPAGTYMPAASADTHGSPVGSRSAPVHPHPAAPIALFRQPALTASVPAPVPAVTPGTHDCCGAATDCVLNPVRGARVTSVSLVTGYDNEYKSINRLLPVYKVSFERGDGIRVYVETTQDRFSFAMDNHRAVFDELFRLFHTWGWLDFLGRGRLLIEMTFALLAFCTTLLGVFIFFSTKSKPVRGNGFVKARLNHRYTAIVASLFTLMWTFSGSYHAFSKFKADTRNLYFTHDRFATPDVALDYPRLLSAVQAPVRNISLVRIRDLSYWRVTTCSGPDLPVHKDLMKDGKAPLPSVAYINTSGYSLLPGGDSLYATWLASSFSAHPVTEIRSVNPVTAFGDEYNFTDKRLPVWKVGYNANGHERYYVETGSGKLSSRVDDGIMAEGTSFSLFHKHHFMDWGGKTLRDISTMWWALAQVFMVLIGLTLYIKWLRRTKMKTKP